MTTPSLPEGPDNDNFCLLLLDVRWVQPKNFPDVAIGILEAAHDHKAVLRFPRLFGSGLRCPVCQLVTLQFGVDRKRRGNLGRSVHACNRLGCEALGVLMRE